MSKKSKSDYIRKREGFMPPTHGYNPFSKNNTTEIDTLKEYYNAMPEDWQKTEMAESINPSLSKRNVLLDTANSHYKGEELPELDEEKSAFSKIFTPDMIKGVIGNTLGNTVNAGFNALLQENQLDNQKQLMNAAAQKNAEAVRMQPQLQVEGMKAAGLNPAGVTGTGAPSVQAGAAAGATSTMGNIFSGIADLIAASKAPTEIEKMIAETELTKSQTEDVIPAEVAKIKEETELLNKQVETANNALEQYDAYKGFLEKHMPTVAEDMKLKYESMKAWDKLSPKTRDTIEGIIDGTIKMGPGEYEAFVKDIEAQKLLSDTDRDMLENLARAIIVTSQLKDPKIRKILVEQPKTERRLAESGMATQATQREANKANAQNVRINTQKEVANDLDLMHTSKEAQDILRENNPDSTKDNVDRAKSERRQTKVLEAVDDAAKLVGGVMIAKKTLGGNGLGKSPKTPIDYSTGLPPKPNQRSQNASYDNHRFRMGNKQTAPW